MVKYAWKERTVAVFATAFRRRSLLRQAALFLFPLALTHRVWLEPGYPLGSDTWNYLSLITPTRKSLARGELPVYTDLLYHGQYQFLHPQWFGFYPPALPAFLPSLHVATGLKLVIALHLAAVPVIVFNFVRDELGTWSSPLYAAVWVLPIGSQLSYGHLSMIFAWPWVAIIVHLLRPSRLTRDPEKVGMYIGVSFGMMLLAGSNYYFAYLLLIVTPVIALVGQFDHVKGICKGSLVGVPHVVVLGLIVARDTSGRTLYYTLSLLDVFRLTTGLGLQTLPGPRWLAQGFAVVGAGVFVLAVYATWRVFDGTEPRVKRRCAECWLGGALGAATLVILAGLFGASPSEFWVLKEFATTVQADGWGLISNLILVLGIATLVTLVTMGTLLFADVYEDTQLSWVVALGSTCAVGVLLAGGNGLLYELPLVGSFRVAGRATIVLAAVGLLLSLEGALWVQDSSIGRSELIVMTLLLLSVTQGIVGWTAFEQQSIETTDSDAVAQSLVDAGCRSVWFSSWPTWEQGSPLPIPPSKLSFSAIKADVAVRTIPLSDYGQSWKVHDGNEIAFDALVVNDQLPENETIQLNNPYGYSPQYGSVNTSRFSLVDEVQTPPGNLFIYSSGRCTNGSRSPASKR